MYSLSHRMKLLYNKPFKPSTKKTLLLIIPGLEMSSQAYQEAVMSLVRLSAYKYDTYKIFHLSPQTIQSKTAQKIQTWTDQLRSRMRVFRSNYLMHWYTWFRFHWKKFYYYLIQFIGKYLTIPKFPSLFDTSYFLSYEEHLSGVLEKYFFINPEAIYDWTSLYRSSFYNKPFNIAFFIKSLYDSQTKSIMAQRSTYDEIYSSYFLKLFDNMEDVEMSFIAHSMGVGVFGIWTTAFYEHLDWFQKKKLSIGNIQLFNGSIFETKRQMRKFFQDAQSSLIVLGAYDPLIHLPTWYNYYADVALGEQHSLFISPAGHTLISLEKQENAVKRLWLRGIEVTTNGMKSTKV